MDRPKREGRKPTPLAVRFWAKVAVAGPNECWIWQGSICNGYGHIGEGGTNGRILKAHRVAYELRYGPIPAGLLVCHTCDTPACVNPAHLFVGTSQDNSDDCMEKGRHVPGDARGSRNGHAKLVEAEVAQILADLRAGACTQSALAKRYKVDPSIISDIWRGKIWRHVPRITRIRRSRR